MTSNSLNNWKCLWRWITFQNLSVEDLQAILDKKEVKDALLQGLKSYKSNKPELFPQLQSKYPDQQKLLNVVQTLQNYLDVDTFQIWDLIKHYLCNISYGTLSSALKNVAFVDTRPTFLLPNIWNFYYTERLFLLRLLQYIIDNKNDPTHKYQKVFCNIYNSINKNLMSSLIEQFENVLTTAPPPRKIQNDFGSELIRQEWAEYNLREQLALLQLILLLVDEESISVENFQTLFKAFKRHNFGKNQGYHELLEDRHREMCMQIMYLESCLFILVCSKKQQEDASLWIGATEKFIDPELTKLQLSAEHSPMLLSWMLLSLESKNHAKQFESKFQHYGSTALRMHVFEFLNQMVTSAVSTDNSKCSKIIRHTIFKTLNTVCDKFDGDGTVSRQAGVGELCAELLSSPDVAEQFWELHRREERFGAVSLWNTALEYFPYDFSTLSRLAGGLARAGDASVRNLIGELKSLPVYTELYNPAGVPLASVARDEAMVGRRYSPVPGYTVEAGSRATVMERKEGTMIHFHTPCSYWTVLNDEIEKALDRKYHHRLDETLQRVYEGIKVLTGAVSVCRGGGLSGEVERCAGGALDLLVRLGRAHGPPPLVAAALRLCAALVPAAPDQIHLRLVNTGVLPRVQRAGLGAAEYAAGAAVEPWGAPLAAGGDRAPLHAYLRLLEAFQEHSMEGRVWRDILLPGVVVALREALPGARPPLLAPAARLLAAALQRRPAGDRALDDAATLLQHTVLYSLLYTENARELLEIVSIGNDQLEKMMLDETNWVSGPRTEWLGSLQRCVAVVMLALRLKHAVAPAADLTPLEHRVRHQDRGRSPRRVVPHVASYINHVFNRSLPALACRLLKRFAEGFQMSLFSSLDMSAYQVRVMFLDRLRDEHEGVELKVAVLEFVAACVGSQPGLTEAFFMMNRERAESDERNKALSTDLGQQPVVDDSFEGILGYMADYLGTIKSDAKLLHSPLLGCIMGLFHALWKNNMQILVKKLRENPKFWEHLTSPLFDEIQPGLRTYAQIFNVLGIELFAARDALEPGLQEVLDRFFDTDKRHLDRWIDFIFSFEGREGDEEAVDKVPVWLGLLTSWKDFTTIACRRPPARLNIAHKSAMVAPCARALAAELAAPRDPRLVVVLAELYAGMLAAWRDDCFDNRKASARQVERLLSDTCAAYEGLHPRGARALLAAATGAVGCLDYELRHAAAARTIARAVTQIVSFELDALLARLDAPPAPAPPAPAPEPDPPTVVLALALLERCLATYDEEFAELAPRFQEARFVNKLLCCLHACAQDRRHLSTTVAALRCLTTYARGPYARDLLTADVDQFLWLRLLPPPAARGWKPREWGVVYARGLDLVAAMVASLGHLWAGEAVTFAGVQLEPLADAVLAAPADLPLASAALGLVVQLVRYEPRWRMQNLHSLQVIMRSISVCLHQCVTLALRARRPPSPDHTLPPPGHAAQPPDLLHRSVELMHMCLVCLLSFSPPLLTLLAGGGSGAGGGGSLERWPPLVELSFGAPKLAEPHPQLSFGTLLAAICLLTRLLNHAYQSEEASGSRSPRGRRRACSCGSPGGERRANRSESLTSVSSLGAAPAPDRRLVATALEHAATLLAEQALLAVRDPGVPARHKQLVRRELGSELAAFHDFVRKRVLCAAHGRPHRARAPLGAWPLEPDRAERELVAAARREREPADDAPPGDPPPPPKRAAPDSMREFVLRKHYLDKCARTPPSPVSHSTPAPDRRRAAKRVSWAEPTPPDERPEAPDAPADPPTGLTDVQIDPDEDYFHFMSVVFLYVCQTDL